MKCVLSVLFMLSSLVVYAQGDDTTISQWKGLHSEQERVAQKTLDMFPSTWQEFMELYGWDDNKEPQGAPFYCRQLNDASKSTEVWYYDKAGNITKKESKK